MYLADYHTHTQFSPDAHDPMTVMAQAALDAGMDEICFTGSCGAPDLGVQ